MNRPRQTQHQPGRDTKHPLAHKVNSLRAAAAQWLMPSEINGCDGSVDRCGSNGFRPAPTSTDPPSAQEETDMVRAAGDESEVIWLTRLLAVVASGVLTMMVWLFTPLGW